MELLWDNAILFNDLSLTFSTLTIDTIKEYPMDVHMTYYYRHKDGLLEPTGVEKRLAFLKLSELENFKFECDDAYQIKYIMLYRNTSDKAGCGGLVLDRRSKLGAVLLDRYNKYSYSWFDDYNSDSSRGWGKCSSSDCSE
jgi:hypothetical protein